MILDVLWQLLGFMLVGGLGVAVNGFAFNVCMNYSWGKLVPFKPLPNSSLAWYVGILMAFSFNFALDKWLVFRV